MNVSTICIRFFCCGLLSRCVRILFELWPGGGRGNGTDDDGADAADVVSFIDVEDSVVPVAEVPLIFVGGPWILFIAMITSSNARFPQVLVLVFWPTGGNNIKYTCICIIDLSILSDE